MDEEKVIPDEEKDYCYCTIDESSGTEFQLLLPILDYEILFKYFEVEVS